MKRRWVPAFVGLGSNLDDPVAQVERATEAIHQIAQTRVVVRSSWYWNPPMGPPEQPDYVNGVVGVLTQIGPQEFLAALKRQEKQQGRVTPEVRWGARTIDLDLLLYGRQIIDEPTLTIPHPGITKRPFVIGPLAEIVPEVVIPGVGRVSELVKVSDLSHLNRIEASP